jgi:hypothetical protein
MDVGPAHRLIPWCSALLVQIRGKPATNLLNRGISQQNLLTASVLFCELDLTRTFAQAPVSKPDNCDIVTQQVYNTEQTLIVTANAYLIFQYNKCWGFFCALCELDTAYGLCLEGGEEGTIVGMLVSCTVGTRFPMH